MKKLFLIILLHLFNLQFSNAQIRFNKRLHFGYPAAVFASCAVTDTAYYVSGVFADTVYPYKPSHIFVKFDREGNELFHTILTDTLRTFEAFSTPLLIDADNNLITGGYSGRNSIGKGMVLKFNTEGSLLDSFFYFSPFHPANSFIVSHDMLLVDDGGIIMLNFVEAPTGPSNGAVCVTKLDRDNEIEWQKVYNTQYEDRPGSIIRDGSGYIIGSWRSNTNTNDYNFLARTHLIKIDSIGQKEWEYLSPSQQLQDAANGLVKTDDGGLVIATGRGTEYDVNGSFSQLFWDGYIYKIDKKRALVWEVLLRGSEPSDNYFNKLLAVSDGSGYIAAGNLYNPNYGEGGYDISGWLVKVSPEGDSLWSRLLHHVVSPADFHTFYDVQETPDGGFVMVGESRDQSPGFEFPHQRAWIIKVDEHGCLVPGCHIKTSISEKDSGFIINTYPNPASDYLNIYFRSENLHKNGNFRVVDINGGVVGQFENEFSDVTHIYPVFDLPVGMYFLQYWSDNKLLQASPFVVQR